MKAAMRDDEEDLPFTEPHWELTGPSPLSDSLSKVITELRQGEWTVAGMEEVTPAEREVLVIISFCNVQRECHTDWSGATNLLLAIAEGDADKEEVRLPLPACAVVRHLIHHPTGNNAAVWACLVN